MPGLIFRKTFNPLIPEEIFLASRQHGGNIRQYRKPLNINLGMVIFGAIFLYIIICVVMYLFRDEKVVSYRVQEGVLMASPARQKSCTILLTKCCSMKRPDLSWRGMKKGRSAS